MYLFLFLFISILRSYRIFPYFYKRPLLLGGTTSNIISETNKINNTYTNVSAEEIAKFVEYMKLKTFDYNEIENWDSGEIEWEV